MSGYEIFNKSCTFFRHSVTVKFISSCGEDVKSIVYFRHLFGCDETHEVKFVGLGF